MNFLNFFKKADFAHYQNQDKKYPQVLRVRDFLSLGIGTIISTSIFTLPGEVAAKFAGPAIVFTYLIAAVVAGLVAFAYAEMSSVMPVAGSAYSWISVLFGEGLGWIAGWALLAEYFIAVAFVGSGFSANFQQLITPLNIYLPSYLAKPLGTDGGGIDIIAFIVILTSALIVFKGASGAGKLSQILVVLKIIAILIFIFVGLTVIHPSNYVPFIPKHNPETGFGGFQGIFSGVSMIFLAYIGFDSIAANAAEAKDPKKTMPRGILGSLLISVILFASVTLVLVGMHPYQDYAGNAAPVGWALTQSGHVVISEVVIIIALAGMYIALLGMTLAGSRLFYAFGRDHLLPKKLGQLNKNNLPTNGVIIFTIISLVIGSLFPFTFLAQLMSAGTLIAFMLVSIGIYFLRPRQGHDLPHATYKMPFYPVLPALAFIGSIAIFYTLNPLAKICAGIWFVVGIILYFVYGMIRKHTTQQNKTQ